MHLLSRYILKTVALTTLFICIVLTLIIWLTQSLRLLDFIINGGAPLSMFGGMLLLTMPRFLEVIMPISLALGIIYSFNKFSGDSELIVMQNSGTSPFRLGLSTFLFTLFIAFFVLILAGWGTPLANRQLDHLRDIVKSDYSVGLLRPGVFNVIGDNTTIYIAERNNLQDLSGVFIHMRKKGEPDTTITAQHGGLIMQDKKPFVIVFDGMRQQLNPKTGAIEVLRFERYNLDLSSLTGSNTNTQNDPGELTLSDLFHPTNSGSTTKAELHARMSKPFLTIALALLAIVPFLTSNYNRRGQSVRVTVIISGLVILQCIYLGGVSILEKSSVGYIAVYFIPWAISLYFISLLLNSQQRRSLFAPILWLLGGKERLI